MKSLPKHSLLRFETFTVARLHGLSPSRSIETFQGKTVWEGVVQVFSLSGHPTASRCYAWSHLVDDSGKRKFVAVLHEGPVDSPETAEELQSWPNTIRVSKVRVPPISNLPDSKIRTLPAFLDSGFPGRVTV